MTIEFIKIIDSLDPYVDDLQVLLTDSVNGGASVGFIAPIQPSESISYWKDVAEDIKGNSRLLWVAVEEGSVVGAVQLSLTYKPNGKHRGEVEKLMVHTTMRGKGIAKQLLASLETYAKEIGLRLLVLDTRLGDVASLLYCKVGYIEAGQIPEFAKSSDGELAATVYFYKLLPSQ
ncbi:GNAT family N-acetyltransferase [Vibrio nitrifigilis]|uniref:GNAT family N-acetyltransferase n=1 Tax=Vibrio nitrifigilis TaxID=2789781 RepID=A0ABS0GD61_9VIBR|nr:GNAT family N-acetyltransferase [Vibrio nitrifigilis]MBF9000361.1 GNAT family N-acetyltransferase [Vibrio nitrifigilis]